MSAITEETLICDHCDKRVTAKATTYYGGHPFSNWIHVTIRGGSTRLVELQKKRDFDFCSPTCVTAYFNENGQ